MNAECGMRGYRTPFGGAQKRKRGSGPPAARVECLGSGVADRGPWPFHTPSSLCRSVALSLPGPSRPPGHSARGRARRSVGLSPPLTLVALTPCGRRDAGRRTPGARRRCPGGHTPDIPDMSPLPLANPRGAKVLRTGDPGGQCPGAPGRTSGNIRSNNRLRSIWRKEKRANPDKTDTDGGSDAPGGKRRSDGGGTGR